MKNQLMPFFFYYYYSLPCVLCLRDLLEGPNRYMTLKAEAVLNQLYKNLSLSLTCRRRRHRRRSNHLA